MTALVEHPVKIMIWRPFAVYLVWTNGDKKLVCLCPDNSIPELVAEGLSLYYKEEHGLLLPVNVCGHPSVPGKRTCGYHWYSAVRGTQTCIMEPHPTYEYHQSLEGGFHK